MTAQQVAQEMWNLAAVRVPKRVFIARALAILAKVGRSSVCIPCRKGEEHFEGVAYPCGVGRVREVER